MTTFDLLQEKIIKDGRIKPGNILKVDSFLNHQIDVPFVSLLGKEIFRRFKNKKIDKIITIEASGIGIACLTAVYFGVPVVFAKKSQGANMDKDVYVTDVMSYTHGKVNHVVIAKTYISKGEHVLIMDDFLANGCAVEGLIDLVKQGGAVIEGIAIGIEKGFQGGGDALREKGYDVESLAIIKSMDAKTGTIEFR